MELLFEDLHEYDAAQGYSVPNECINTWRDIVKTIPVYKAAGICSSGEVGFFSILPSVKSNLTLVDHCYSSLYFALIKYLIIKKKGAEEAYRIFTDGNLNDFKSVRESIIEFVPEKIVKSYWHHRGQYGEESLTYCIRDYIPRTWKEIPQEIVNRADKKFGRVKFIHGDLTDLGDKRDHDLLYISNAHQSNHIDRNRRRLMFENMEKIVKPSGYVLVATSQSDFPSMFTDRGWELVEQKKCIPNGNYNLIRWNQNLYRLPS